MADHKQPKVLLFDIGGVCVVSPFQAILDYEISHNIPPGWVNFCISRTAPNGFWHRLERGELLMDKDWFAGFSADLHRPELWDAFHKQQAQKNNVPERPLPPLPRVEAEPLFWTMMHESRTPDPWMFPALKALKQSGRYILAALSNTMIFPPTHPYSQPSPTTDGQDDVRSIFDIFVSSAHVGLRKPDPKIYELALREVNKYSQDKGTGSVIAGDILFLDDIGENLKSGKKAGFRTLKVGLGRAFEAVDELERITGMQLAGNHPRVAVEPKIWKAAKL